MKANNLSIGLFVLLSVLLMDCSSVFDDNIAKTARANDEQTETIIVVLTDQSTATESPTKTPSLIASTLTAIATSTNSYVDDSDNETPFCETRSQPALPCLWKVLPDDLITNTQGDNFVSVARDAYSDEQFALLILNFNRDNQGYQPSLGPGEGKKEFFYLPREDLVNNPLVPFFPSRIPICDEFAIPQITKPCIYLVSRGDTFVEIAQRFYDYDQEAQACIRQANFLFDVSGGIFHLILESELTDGIRLILPVKNDTYC